MNVFYKPLLNINFINIKLIPASCKFHIKVYFCLLFRKISDPFSSPTEDHRVCGTPGCKGAMSPPADTIKHTGKTLGICTHKWPVLGDPLGSLQTEETKELYHRGVCASAGLLDWKEHRTEKHLIFSLQTRFFPSAGPLAELQGMGVSSPSTTGQQGEGL